MTKLPYLILIFICTGMFTWLFIFIRIVQLYTPKAVVEFIQRNLMNLKNFLFRNSYLWQLYEYKRFEKVIKKHQNEIDISRHINVVALYKIIMNYKGFKMADRCKKLLNEEGERLEKEMLEKYNEVWKAPKL